VTSPRLVFCIKEVSAVRRKQPEDWKNEFGGLNPVRKRMKDVEVLFGVRKKKR